MTMTPLAPSSDLESSAPQAAVSMVPRLLPGVELLGEYQGSGYQQPPCLQVRRTSPAVQLKKPCSRCSATTRANRSAMLS